MGSYPSAEMRSVYSTTPAIWAINYMVLKKRNECDGLDNKLLSGGNINNR